MAANKRIAAALAPVVVKSAPVVIKSFKDHVPARPGESKASSAKSAWKKAGRPGSLKNWARTTLNPDALLWLANKASDPHNPPKHRGRTSKSKSKQNT